MKDFPWFRFHPGEWRQNVSDMLSSLEAEGAFLRLCFHAWSREGGVLPKERSVLARLSGLGPKWKEHEQEILFLLDETEAGFRVPFLEPERARVEAAIEQRREAGKASAEARKKKRMSNGRSTDAERPFNDRSTKRQQIEREKEKRERGNENDGLRDGERSSSEDVSRFDDPLDLKSEEAPQKRSPSIMERLQKPPGKST